MLSEATIPLPGGKVKGGGGGFFAANAYLPGSPGGFTPGPPQYAGGAGDRFLYLTAASFFAIVFGT